MTFAHSRICNHSDGSIALASDKTSSTTPNAGAHIHAGLESSLAGLRPPQVRRQHVEDPLDLAPVVPRQAGQLLRVRVQREHVQVVGAGS